MLKEGETLLPDPGEAGGLCSSALWETGGGIAQWDGFLQQHLISSCLVWMSPAPSHVTCETQTGGFLGYLCDALRSIRNAWFDKQVLNPGLDTMAAKSELCVTGNWASQPHQAVSISTPKCNSKATAIKSLYFLENVITSIEIPVFPQLFVKIKLQKGNMGRAKLLSPVIVLLWAAQRAHSSQWFCCGCDSCKSVRHPPYF